jgi:glycine cleavage system H lipoate-binding protein
MDGLRYAESHEWVSVDGDVATVGISDFAQVVIRRCVISAICKHSQPSASKMHCNPDSASPQFGQPAGHGSL